MDDRFEAAALGEVIEVDGQHGRVELPRAEADHARPQVHAELLVLRETVVAAALVADLRWNLTVLNCTKTIYCKSLEKNLYRIS